MLWDASQAVGKCCLDLTWRFTFWHCQPTVAMTLQSRTPSGAVVEVVERQPSRILRHPLPLPTPPRHVHLHNLPLLPLLRAVAVLVFHPGNLTLLCVSFTEILCSNNQAISRQYQGGSQVTYNGHLWVAKWWSQAGSYLSDVISWLRLTRAWHRRCTRW